jgi:DNA-binding MarR family transcriptional regulator
MNASTDPVANALFGLNTVGSPNEPIDVVLRAIILEIAKANMNGHPVREKDIVRKLNHTSHLSVHRRLEMLVEINLIAKQRNPEDRRERLLYLAPSAQEKLDRFALEIRQLFEKQYI